MCPPQIRHVSIICFRPFDHSDAVWCRLGIVRLPVVYLQNPVHLNFVIWISVYVLATSCYSGCHLIASIA
jgi:hypothetical protein